MSGAYIASASTAHINPRTALTATTATVPYHCPLLHVGVTTTATIADKTVIRFDRNGFNDFLDWHDDVPRR
jgi:hypothetical protein